MKIQLIYRLVTKDYKMRNLLVFLMALCCITGCDKEKPVTPPPVVVPPVVTPVAVPAPAPSKYMDPAKVLELFKKKSAESLVETLNDNAKVRLNQLVAKEEFLSKKLLAKVKARQAMKGKMMAQAFTGKGSVDLRDQSTEIVDQFGGTCTAHGLTAAIETTIGKPHQKLSERHVWSGYKQYSCDAAIERWSGTKSCVTLDSAWPHDNVHPYKGYLDSDNCYSFLVSTTSIDDDLQKMINALDIGHAVYLGIGVTKSLMNCDVALDPNSAAVSGGHALDIVGYKLDASVAGGGYFIIKQSWGPDCGDHGYQYVPFNYCQRSDLYCVLWSIDEVTSVSSGMERK
jgi:C1A family cysteine protease